MVGGNAGKGLRKGGEKEWDREGGRGRAILAVENIRGQRMISLDTVPDSQVKNQINHKVAGKKNGGCKEHKRRRLHPPPKS